MADYTSVRIFFYQTSGVSRSALLYRKERRYKDFTFFTEFFLVPYSSARDLIIIKGINFSGHHIQILSTYSIFFLIIYHFPLR